MLTAAIFAAILYGCEKLPTVDFTFDPLEITVYDTVTFTNASTDADSYTWDFGDGTTSTDASPTHIFMASGNFTVKLVASNEDGEKETSQSFTVNGLPESGRTIIVLPESIIFCFNCCPHRLSTASQIL